MNAPRPTQGSPDTGGTTLDAKDSLPPSVDLRPLLDGWGLGPRIQGKRNTCSAFVVTGALEFALARREGRGTRLSVEFLNWASNRATRDHEDGGFFSDLWKGFEAHGISPEADLPYLPEFQPRLRPSETAREHAKEILGRGLQLHWIKEWDPKTGLTEAQLDEVRRVLACGWPVCGGFLWPKQEVWEQDVLQICPPDQVRDGHSVLLVGYRDDAARSGPAAPTRQAAQPGQGAKPKEEAKPNVATQPGQGAHPGPAAQPPSGAQLGQAAEPGQAAQASESAHPGGGLFIIRNTAKDGRDGYVTYEYLRTYMNDAAWIAVDGDGGGQGAAPAAPPGGQSVAPGASPRMRG